MQFLNNTVEAFGKLIYPPKETTYPMLPDLNILIFKQSEDNGIYTYTAVCIELELDTCGDSFDDIQEELKQVIAIYFNAQARSCDSIEEFAQKIINTIYTPSKQKEELYNIYREVKRNYLMSRAKKSNIQMPRIEPSNVTTFLFKNDTIKLSPAAVI